MITKELIDRINELARYSKERELSNEEKEEQINLRKIYLAGFRSNMESTLDKTYIMDGKGNKRKVEKKK